MDASHKAGAGSHRPRPQTGAGRLLALLGAIASLALIASPAGAAAGTAKPADSFVESIGVNTHFSYDDTVYASRFDEVKQKLAELGIRHIREGLEPNRPDQYQELNSLASAGIESTLILGDPGGGPAGLEELISTLRANVRGATEAVEGPNEYDSSGGPDWATQLSDYQRRLYSAIKGDPGLASLPVIGPSIVQHRNQESFGDISSALDYGNFHPYPDGEAPETNLDSELAHTAANSGPKPVMATETGYHNALNWSGDHRPTSEEAAATYMPRLFLDYFSQGVTRTFSYELLDEFPDPGKADRESNFGLLRNDLSEKPAFVALRNTIKTLEDPGPEFTPEALDFKLGGDQTDLRQVLLQKRDGSFYLALWRASSVWNPDTHTPISVPSAPVTLDFDRSVKSAQQYVPNVSTGPVGTVPVRADRPLTVNVGAQVTILRLEVGGTAARGRIKLWVSKRSVPAGGRVAVRGQLPQQAAGRSLPVKIQRWHKGWRTVGHSHTSRSGVFRKKIRLPARIDSRASRLRVVARTAKPSKAVRLRIRKNA